MFSSPIALTLLLVASCTVAEEFSPNDVLSEKSSPLGFDRSQGVKSLRFSENEEFAKRAAMGFQGMRGKKNVRQDNSAPSDDFDKRSPMGFHGMRGKKELLEPNFANSYFIDEYLKRAPMGFQGMRGKKAIMDEEYYKRAAMGFQGMRGKKSSDVPLEGITNLRFGNFRAPDLVEYSDEYEKRAPMGFQGMRGKREEFEDEWAKRAPMGFQGMRGKKNFLEEMNDLEKRAMMGFQGMRGKKSVANTLYDAYRTKESLGTDLSDGDRSDSKFKRLNIGFVGSRGKRSEVVPGDDYFKISAYDLKDSLTDDIAEDLFLRDRLGDRMNVAPLQFYKRSAYGYSGTRGKKIPRWEIRGKFIGVRGKKWSKSNYEDTGDSRNNVHSNNERIDSEIGSTRKIDIQ